LPVFAPLATESIWPNGGGKVDLSLVKDFLLAEGDFHKKDLISLLKQAIGVLGKEPNLMY
jgi:hypothetical protein